MLAGQQQQLDTQKRWKQRHLTCVLFHIYAFWRCFSSWLHEHWFSKVPWKLWRIKLKFASRTCHLSYSWSMLWETQKLSSTKRKTTLILDNFSLQSRIYQKRNINWSKWRKRAVGQLGTRQFRLGAKLSVLLCCQIVWGKIVLQSENVHKYEICKYSTILFSVAIIVHFPQIQKKDSEIQIQIRIFWNDVVCGNYPVPSPQSEPAGPLHLPPFTPDTAYWSQSIVSPPCTIVHVYVQTIAHVQIYKCNSL